MAPWLHMLVSIGNLRSSAVLQTCQLDGCALKFLMAKFPDVERREEAVWSRVSTGQRKLNK